jgi:hypothetical protein
MRKMMSLVIEDTQAPDDRPRFFLYCKGADTTIMSKVDRSTRGIKPAEAAEREAIIARTNTHLRCACTRCRRTHLLFPCCHALFSFSPLFPAPFSRSLRSSLSHSLYLSIYLNLSLSHSSPLSDALHSTRLADLRPLT